MKKQEKRLLIEQMKADMRNASAEIPKELRKELLMNIKKQPWVFSMQGYERQLRLLYPELEEDIRSIFGGQIALGKMIKWNDI